MFLDDTCTFTISRVTMTHNRQGLEIVPEPGIRFSTTDADGTKEVTLQLAVAQTVLSEVLRKAQDGEPFEYPVVVF